MAVNTPAAEDERDYILVAKLDNAKNLSSILKTVAFIETATCFISDNGLKVTVEQAKCVQCSAFIQASIFQQFTFTSSTPAVFRINLNTLIECLSIFGGGGSGAGGGQEASHASLKMSYVDHGHPLSLLLEEGDVLTDCKIQTQDAEETLDFDFTSANVVNKIIMQATCLSEAFAELDTSSDVLEMHTSDSTPFFRLSTFGYAGTTQIDYPKDSEMIEVFECTKTLVNRYKLVLLKPCSRALNCSSKVSLRIDQRGFLSLQCMILTEDRQPCFVEFLCVPEEDIED